MCRDDSFCQYVTDLVPIDLLSLSNTHVSTKLLSPVATASTNDEDSDSEVEIVWSNIPSQSHEEKLQDGDSDKVVFVESSQVLGKRLAHSLSEDTIVHGRRKWARI